MKLLLDRGADPNASDCFGQSAVFSARLTALHVLLTRSDSAVDLTVRDSMGNTPLLHLCSRLSQKGSEYEGRAEYLAWRMLKRGCCVREERDRERRTALMLSAASDTRVTERLIPMLVQVGGKWVCDCHVYG